MQCSKTSAYVAISSWDRASRRWHSMKDPGRIEICHQVHIQGFRTRPYIEKFLYSGSYTSHLFTTQAHAATVKPTHPKNAPAKRSRSPESPNAMIRKEVFRQAKRVTVSSKLLQDASLCDQITHASAPRNAHRMTPHLSIRPPLPSPPTLSRSLLPKHFQNRSVSSPAPVTTVCPSGLIAR